MEKYTEKIRNIYQEILALDTIYNILSWHDRTILHRYNNGETYLTFSTKLELLYDYVSNNNWKTPYMKYGQDRLLYFYDEKSEQDHPIEDYKIIYTAITNDLKLIQSI